MEVENPFTMIYRKIITGSLAALILLSSVFACSAAKDVEERKNLMMPKKSEMSRNSRFKEAPKKKTNKYSQPKSRHKRLF